MIEIPREEFVKRGQMLNGLGSNKDLDIIVKAICKNNIDDAKLYDRLTKDGIVLLDREGWEEIKALIENYPNCLKCDEYFKGNGCKLVYHEDIEKYCLKDKWFEKLRKAVMEG